jgi:hypothetical protein
MLRDEEGSFQPVLHFLRYPWLAELPLAMAVG